jgi:TPR repeat protein
LAIEALKQNFGIGVIQDHFKAKEKILKIASKENEFIESIKFYFGWENERNYLKSLNLLTQILEDKSLIGNEELRSYCLCLIGMIYDFGQIPNIQKNIKISIECYNKAAHLNNPEALFNLSEIYQTGVDYIEKDFKKSIKYLKKAAKLNHYLAIKDYAEYYELGKEECIKIDILKAIKIYEKGAKLKFPYAFIKLGELYRYGGENFAQIDLNKSALNFFLVFELTQQTKYLILFRRIINCHKVEWREEYHAHWSAPNSINHQIFVLLLISKKRKSSKNLLIPNLFVKGIVMKIIQFLCHFKQIILEEKYIN